DIIVLPAQGLANRGHGGLVALDATPEPPLTVRSSVMAKEKRASARTAARLLQPGQTVFLDAGSTIIMLWVELRSIYCLTVFTLILFAAF
ncbi:DeoR/GlpR transcriptional regulator, partial [Erwinia amylovora]|nr:DeoR/GlpR transcriptional regulator [Erwinia amylovora]